MSTGSIVALLVVLVVVGLAWAFLKRRRDDGDAPPAAAPWPALVVEPEVPQNAAAAVAVAPTVVAARVSAPPTPPAAKPAPPQPPVAVARPAAPSPARPAAPPPVESVTAIMARPRPAAPVIARVLALELTDEAEWESAQPLALSAVQGAAVAGLLAAAPEAQAIGPAVYGAGFGAGSAMLVARADLDAIRALAAAPTEPLDGHAVWLDSVAATTLVATALGALAGERWLDGLGNEMRDLKATIAALPAKLAAQDNGRLKGLIQDLSRFAREARDNYASVVGKTAFRERVGEGCERAAAVWHELVASADALRQQLEEIVPTTRFGESQIEASLARWRELQVQERLQEIAARVLAGMHTLRLALGDAAAGAGAGVDPLASAVAALQGGFERNRDLASRLDERETGARGDPYVGRKEFEANRAALRKLLDKPVSEPMLLALRRLEAAAATGPLDAAPGLPSRLLVRGAPGEASAALRWSSAPGAA